MKKAIIATAGLLTLVLATSVKADVGDLTPTIPFAFTVSGTTLPPGAYTVAASNRGVVSIRGDLGGVLLLSRPQESRNRELTPRLVFHRYGDRYFLRSVWFSARKGLEVPETMEERELSTRRNARAVTPEVVAIQPAAPAQ